MLSLQLRSAATDGDVDKLLRFLQGASPTEKDEEDYTPLHYAAWGGCIPLVDALLANKTVLVSSRNQNGETPLHLAAGYGRLETVQKLLMAGAKVNARDNLNYTPLHRAAEGQWGVTGWEGTGGRESQHEDVVRLLLSNDADPTLRDSFGRTPLDVACDKLGIRQILQASQTSALRERNHTVEAMHAAPPTPTSNVDDWDRNAVGVWLRQIGLPQYEAIFSEKGINGKFLLTRMTSDKLNKLITDEFHVDIFNDALDELKAAHMTATERSLRGGYVYAAMPERSKPTNVRSILTLDNPTGRPVRVYHLDDGSPQGQANLKRILQPFQTVTEEAYEGTVFYLSDDKTGDRLGWVQVLSKPTMIHAPDVVMNAGDVDLLPPAYSD